MIITYSEDALSVSKPCEYKISFDGLHTYIGSTKRGAKKRIDEHISLLKCNKHYNRKMQVCYNNCQEMKAEVLEFSDKDDVCKREQFYIDTLNPDINIVRKVAKY